jgi:uncharacterized membrane protein YbhN (UPF0104 family)
MSFAFVIAFVLRNWSAIRVVRLSAPGMLGAAALIYAVSHLTTALSWPMTLRAMGKPLPFAFGIRTGFVAQIGKYLPGNIAHYVGRAAIAKDHGLSLTSSGISTGIEMLAGVLSAVIVAVVAFLYDPAPVAFLRSEFPHLAFARLTPAPIVLAVVLAAVGILIFGRVYSVRVLLSPMLCLTLSFLLAALSFYSVVCAMTAGATLSSVTGIFVLAWTVGFLVPGAPAGIGLREAILIGFLSPMIGSGNAVASAILHRLITAGTDSAVAVGGYAWLFLAKKKKSANDVLSMSRMSSG